MSYDHKKQQYLETIMHKISRIFAVRDLFVRADEFN